MSATESSNERPTPSPTFQEPAKEPAFKEPSFKEPSFKDPAFRGQPLKDYETAPSTPLATRSSEEGERNPVFSNLVTGDGDVVGLVAYSVYKQNKHDWLLAFSKMKGRDPSDDEMAAYIVGESTPRRLATYRHLAHATLEGKGPDVTTGPSAHGGMGRTLLAASRPGQHAEETPLRRYLGYIITAVVVALAVLLAVRFGLIPVSR